MRRSFAAHYRAQVGITAAVPSISALDGPRGPQPPTPIPNLLRRAVRFSWPTWALRQALELLPLSRRPRGRCDMARSVASGLSPSSSVEQGRQHLDGPLRHERLASRHAMLRREQWLGPPRSGIQSHPVSARRATPALRPARWLSLFPPSSASGFAGSHQVWLSRRLPARGRSDTLAAGSQAHSPGLLTLNA
jgi:hypothetical protein